MISSRYLSLALLLIALAVPGCGTTETPPQASPSTSTRPGIGSRFVYEYYDVNERGAEIAGTKSLDTFTVTRVTTLGGKSDVVVMESSKSGERYYHYEPNGDVSVSAPDRDGSSTILWGVLPVGSHARVGWPTRVENTYMGGVVTGTVAHDDTLSFVGSEPVLAAGQSFTCARLRDDGISFYRPEVVKYVFLNDIWYAPTLGVWVRLNSVGDSYYQGTKRALASTRQNLIAYTLK